jgi:osmotically inducible protein OsmC
MALSNGLARAGTPPDRIEVKATSTFVPGTGITAMRLDVTGRVQGMDESAFQDAAREAGENCPVSQALKGNVEISVDAHLA